MIKLTILVVCCIISSNRIRPPIILVRSNQSNRSNRSLTCWLVDVVLIFIFRVLIILICKIWSNQSYHHTHKWNNNIHYYHRFWTQIWLENTTTHDPIVTVLAITDKIGTGFPVFFADGMVDAEIFTCSSQMLTCLGDKKLGGLVRSDAVHQNDRSCEVKERLYQIYL